MQPPPSLSRRHRSLAHHTPAASLQGSALIVVLCFLALLTFLAVAFLANISSEYRTATTQANTISVRQLADSTVQYVIGQIRLATSDGITNTWASQPGMIRTYNNSGSALNAYKLYSAAAPVVAITNSSYNPGVDLPGSSWSNDTALWSDLNAPVYDASNNPVFPIIDPRAAAIITSGTNSSPLVEGFSYTNTVAGSVQPSSTNSTNALLPMPVRWIYVLQDGEFTTPSGGSGTTADFSSSSPQPTTQNPIVGRVAFWTDDETCKLNLNTAAGGVPWNPPTYTTGLDMCFSRYKPTQNEFTRYPGHPASTSLLPVFWSYGGLPSPNLNIFPQINPPGPPYYSSKNGSTVSAVDVVPSLTSVQSNFLSTTLALSPRNAWGGSAMATAATVTTTGTPPNQPLNNARLFATMDEALYGNPGGGTNRPTNAFGMQPTDVERLRFFLTARSSSPDINPYNQPKVGCWPVPDPSMVMTANPGSTLNNTQTAPDKLIAFCSTLGTNAYYFTRHDATSPSNDFLNDSLKRNASVFNYLVNSMGNPIPGFGGNFVSRYTSGGCTQMITLIYDYIRSCINVTDMTTLASSSYGDPYAYVGTNTASGAGNGVGIGTVVPIQIATNGSTYQGLGRYLTIKEAALQFIAVAANQPPCLINPTSGNPVSSTSPITDLTPANTTALTNTNGVFVGISTTGLVNPMHPWVSNPPSSVGLILQGISNAYSGTPVTYSNNPLSNTWIICSSSYSNCPSNSYPSFTNSSGGNQTHAGLPFLTTNWCPLQPWTNISTNNIQTNFINTRYQGPTALYGANGAALPNPYPITGTSTNLGPHQTQIQAVLLLDPVTVTPGAPAMMPYYTVKVTGLQNFTADGQSLGFTSSGSQSVYYPAASYAYSTMDAALGNYTISTYDRTTNTVSSQFKLSLLSKPVIVGPNTSWGQTFSFSGGTITVQILNSANTNQVIQTFSINFPSATFPTPLLPPMPIAGAADTATNSHIGLINYPNTLSATYRSAGIPSSAIDLAPSTLLTFDMNGALSTNPNFGTGASYYNVNKAHTTYGPSPGNNLYPENYILPARMTTPIFDYNAKLTADTVRAVEVLYGDTRLTACLNSVGTNFFSPHRYYYDTNMRSAHTLRLGPGYPGGNMRGATDDGLSTNVTYYTNGTNINNTRGYPTSGYPSGSYPWQANIQPLGAPDDVNGGNAILSTFPHVTSSAELSNAIYTNYGTNASFATIWATSGDYDTGVGIVNDGPFANKADEGAGINMVTGQPAYTANPEFCISDMFVFSSNSMNTPNRQIPSAGVFGSLPVGFSPTTATPANAWRTLLFCPNPGSINHPSLAQVSLGGAIPGTTPVAPDFLMLDFFQMPVVEPYAISEPFVTAGRVNMNYQIAPFTNIVRTTALRGVLHSELVTAVQDQYVKNRKMPNNEYDDGTGGPYTTYLKNTGQWAFRYPINVDQTLLQFSNRFALGDLFRSPSEICSLWLYPGIQPGVSGSTSYSGPLVSYDSSSVNISAWWYNNPGTTAMTTTSDNMREWPYTTLYPRLATKSNTYTVHFRVQLLKKSPNTSATSWVDGTDKVLGEYRGSSMIERYIDASDTTIPDFTQSANSSLSLDSYYQFRVMNTKRFAP